MGKKKEAYLEKSRAYKGFHYTEIPKEMLQYLHDRTLEMLKEVVDIFNRNGIRYMVCGGTLLGAVTTGNFIPWDDDVDLCVLKEDYGRMVDCLIKELGKGVILQCGKTEKNYYLDWVKVRDKDSHVYPDIPYYKENGVWIDIYELVPCRAKWLGYKVAKGNLDYVKRRYKKGGLTKAEYRERINRKKLKAAVFSGWLKGFFSRDNGERYIIWSASKVAVKKEWVQPSSKVRFEGMELPNFHNADAYLAEHYGEGFRNLPPDGMRRVGINRVEVKNLTGGGADRLIVICVELRRYLVRAYHGEERCA